MVKLFFKLFSLYFFLVIICNNFNNNEFQLLNFLTHKIAIVFFMAVEDFFFKDLANKVFTNKKILILIDINNSYLLGMDQSPK